MDPNTDNKPLINENVGITDQQRSIHNSQNAQQYPQLAPPPVAIPYIPTQRPAQNYPQQYGQPQSYGQPYGFPRGYQPNQPQHQNQPPPYLQDPRMQQPVFVNQAPHPGYVLPGQTVVNIPNITVNHPYYARISSQTANQCPRCYARGTDMINYTPGCAATSWAVCLFCFTGILCCWIPFVVDDCKDMVIICSRCGTTKAVIQRDCC